jgi:hypothetical protein
VSIAACLSIVFIFGYFPSMRTWSYTLVVLMVGCSIGANASLLISVEHPDDDPGLCVLQGVAMQFFDLAGSLWSVVIAFSLYSVVVLQRRIDSAFKRNSHLVVWGLSLGFTALPFTTDSYGSSGTWCWIRAPAGDTSAWAHDAGTVWRILCFFLPIWLNIFAIAFFYYRVSTTISNYMRMSVILGAGRPNVVEMEKLSASLYLFPVVFVVAWSVATGSRVYHWAHPENHDVRLAYLQVTFGNGAVAQALGNALVYNSTRAVHARWGEVLADARKALGCEAAAATGEAGKASESFAGRFSGSSAASGAKKAGLQPRGTLTEPLLNSATSAVV